MVRERTEWRALLSGSGRSRADTEVTAERDEVEREREGGGTETESLLTRRAAAGTEALKGTKEGEDGAIKVGRDDKSEVEKE